MKTNFEMIKEFHDVFSRTPRPEKPTQISSESRMLRAKLIFEEFKEVLDDLRINLMVTYESEIVLDNEGGTKLVHLPSLAKELADLLYVVYGTADVYGIPIDDVFREVHESNMSKLDDNGEVLRREDGKVLKGPNYRPPNLDKFFSS